MQTRNYLYVKDIPTIQTYKYETILTFLILEYDIKTQYVHISWTDKELRFHQGSYKKKAIWNENLKDYSKVKPFGLESKMR